MVGFFAAVDGNCDLDNEIFVITLSKNKEYMEDYLDFHQDKLENPAIAKYSIFTGKKKLFNPWNPMHRFILSTSIYGNDVYIDKIHYDKKDYIFRLNNKNNAKFLEEMSIMTALYEVGFSGFYSDDRGYRLYSIFEPNKHLTCIESQPYIK
jgi:hypothetical protein